MNNYMQKFIDDFNRLYNWLAAELEAEINTDILHKIEDLVDYYGQKHEIFFTEDEKLNLELEILKKVRTELDAIIHEKLMQK